MNFLKRLQQFEVIAFVIYIVGVTLDYVSTRIGLPRFFAFETNQLILYLVVLGIWTQMTVISIIITATAAYFARKLPPFGYKGLIRWTIMVWLIYIGIVKTYAGMHNFILYGSLL